MSMGFLSKKNAIPDSSFELACLSTIGNFLSALVGDLDIPDIHVEYVWEIAQFTALTKFSNYTDTLTTIEFFKHSSSVREAFQEIVAKLYGSSSIGITTDALDSSPSHIQEIQEVISKLVIEPYNNDFSQDSRHKIYAQFSDYIKNFIKLNSRYDKSAAEFISYVMASTFLIILTDTRNQISNYGVKKSRTRLTLACKFYSALIYFFSVNIFLE